MSKDLEQMAASAFAIGQETDIKAASLLFKYVIPLSVCTFDDRPLTPNAWLGSYYHFCETRDAVLGAIQSCGYQHLIKSQVHTIGYDTHEIYGCYVPVEGAESEINTALFNLIDSNAEIPETFLKTRVQLNAPRTFRDWIISINFKEVRAPFYGYDLAGGSDPAVNGVLLTITNVPWIDLQKTPWEQIHEFRKDDESIRHFRSFRLFVMNTYVGKSQAYIQDDFMRRVDTFEAARKKHGFELQTSTLKSVLNSKYILGGGLSGLMAWLFGAGPHASVIGSAAIVAGASVEIANVVLDIRSARFALNHQIDTAELAYVIKAKDRLERK